MLSHFPIALSIAADAIVSLIGHAHDARAPAETAWLLAGAMALGLLALIVTEQSLVDAERLFSVYRLLSMVLAIGAVAALVVGWVRPAPWLLALLLVAVLSVIWAFAVLRFLSADALGRSPSLSTERRVLHCALMTPLIPTAAHGQRFLGATLQGDGLVASKAAENR